MPKAVALLLACFVAAAHANPAARPRRDITALGGAWNGSHIEQRRSCRSVQNEGFHGTYAEYSIYVDPLSPALTITETAVTGLICCRPE